MASEVAAHLLIADSSPSASPHIPFALNVLMSMAMVLPLGCTPHASCSLYNCNGRGSADEGESSMVAVVCWVLHARNGMHRWYVGCLMQGRFAQVACWVLHARNGMHRWYFGCCMQGMVCTESSQVKAAQTK